MSKEFLAGIGSHGRMDAKEIAYHRRMLDIRAEQNMKLSFTERVDRATKGEPDMLTQEEIKRIQNSSYWTRG